MMLFICHASEDRDFVRPLAEALSKEYEKIWYSEYELRIGDPLLDKIDEGLARCDFGIVVLSKPFFEKSGHGLNWRDYLLVKLAREK